MAWAQPSADRQRHVRAAGLPALEAAHLSAARPLAAKIRWRDPAAAKSTEPFRAAGGRVIVEETMPLTTVARGRVFDWSHAVGRGAARGTGFNYIQTMCLGKNGVLYATNRGN